MEIDHATIPVRVSALTSDPFTSLPVVILVDDLGRTHVAISIGLSEATAIATELDGIELERPMTHHLTAALLARAGARVESVEIHDLIESTFYATIGLVLANGERVNQDARPSDALALALHTGAEIRVAATVVDKLSPGYRVDGGGEDSDGWGPALPYCGDESIDLLEGLGDDVFGKWKI